MEEPSDDTLNFVNVIVVINSLVIHWSLAMETCKECSRLQQRIDISLTITEMYSWLLDSYVLDYYVDKHWQKLPPSWQNTFKDVDPQELSSLINNQTNELRSKRPWPLSLLTLRYLLVKLQLSRKQVAESFQAHLVSHCRGKNCHEHRTEIKVPSVLAPTAKVNETLGEHLISKVDKVLTRHVKPKKQYEINSMAKVTAQAAEHCDVKLIVDVGSGLGHLSRMLAYRYGLQVCCIEAQGNLLEQARILDNDTEKYLSKYLSAEEMKKLCRPVHINAVIDSQFTALSLMKELRNAYGIGENDLKFGIIGLHPCGDLAPILLKLFTGCPDAVFINVVGCCYMKISTNIEGTPKFMGYPLSTFVSKRPHMLSFEAREIACHAIETYRDRLHAGDYENLKIHCFRALLEKILVKHWPHLRHSVVKSIKHYSGLNFRDYCEIATARLGVKIPSEDFFSEETCLSLSEWKKVVTFYTLRLMLAPLVETIILLDRLLFLQELEIGSALIPLFDPKISPRNHILIALKHFKF
ncbi:methyltransferase-like protein 25B isoform X1 [Schistocerca piceifrons]|uniref:methyltransferase-like protein 25B isoform X1 n=2 Tax=Schistocerca piceifrons TaxID=274613 RepID=UPI001F5EED6C|nr:methyltransferase-like protein 25B isoform X1 [Schistocerca piceifrons]